MHFRKPSRVFVAFAALITLCCALSLRVDAGNILQDYGLALNDPDDPTDDQSYTYDIKWNREDDHFYPPRFYLYKNLLDKQVLDPGIYPPRFFQEDIPPERDMNPAFIAVQFREALEKWNGCPFNDFEFDADAFGFADFMVVSFSNAWPSEPVDSAQFDGYNIVTFRDPAVSLGDEENAVTSVFYVNQEFELPTEQGKLGFPTEVIDDDSFIGGGQFVEVFDTDSDGFYDIILPLKTYQEGELLDADIIFNSTATDWVRLPEDPRDLEDLDWLRQDAYSQRDIVATFIHEIGHAHGLAHSNLVDTTMYAFSDVASLDPLPSYPIDPYMTREPAYDDFVSQHLLYPAEIPPDLAVFTGQVLEGDFLDTISSGDDPATPHVLQVPVYLCVPSLEPERQHPDNTDYFNSDGPGGYTQSGQTASFVSDPLALPIPFRKIASVPTGLRMRINTFPPEVSMPPNSQGGSSLNAGPEWYDSTFYIPGIPPRDDYALYIDNPALDNVSIVMSDFAPDHTFLPEFYGGASAPIFGNGFAESNAVTGDNKLASNWVEAVLDVQGRVSVGVPGDTGDGFGLTSGHPDQGASYPIFSIDGELIDLRKRAPGSLLNPVIIDDPANLALGSWVIDSKLTLEWQVAVTSSGGRGIEPPPLPPNDIRVSYTFRNISDLPVEVGVRQVWDLVAMASEGPVYFTEDGQLTTTTEFSGEDVPKYILFQDDEEFPTLKGILTLLGAGTSPIAPSRVVIEDMDTINSTGFEVAAMGKDIVSRPAGRLVNTGAAIVFEPRTLAPNTAATFAVVIGTLRDPAAFLLDSFSRDPIVIGTPFYDNETVAERLSAVAGETLSGITIITDTGDGAPTLVDPPIASGTKPPDGAIFTLENDRIPVETWFCVDGEAADLDNDGDVDIVIANAGSQLGEPPFNRILENRFIPDGEVEFIDVTFGDDGLSFTSDDRLQPLSQDSTLGVSLADFDNDGFVDIFFSNNNSLSGVEEAPNQLYRNRADGTLTFDDVSDFIPLPGSNTPVLPSRYDLNSDPGFRADPSTEPAAGDIDSDGDIDLIVPVYGLMMGGLDPDRDAFQDRIWTEPDTDPAIVNFDGLYRPVPPPDTPEVDAWEVDERLSELWVSERILINQYMETGVMYFLDDTLGRDHGLGGFQPIGGTINFANMDRMPPHLPDVTSTGPNINEEENPWSQMALLASVIGDDSLDLLIPELFISDVMPGVINQPYLRVYNNLDMDGDMRPDGFFAQVDWGCDFTIFKLGYSSQFDTLQRDLYPFLLSIPSGYPNSADPGGSSTNDVFPHQQASLRGCAVADMRYEGYNAPIAAASLADSYYFPYPVRNGSTIDGRLGSWRFIPGSVSAPTGVPREFLNQIPWIDLNVSILGDRYPAPYYAFEFPVEDPPTPPGNVKVMVTKGDPWDYMEDTPAWVEIEQGQEDEELLYAIPFETIGNFIQETIPTSDGNHTTDVIVADFDRDGDVDMVFLNDYVGDEIQVGGGEDAPNQYFENTFQEDDDGIAEDLTDVSTAALALEPEAQSQVAVCGDFDNDGDEDLYIGNYSQQNHLLLNYTFHAPPDLRGSSEDDQPMFYDANVEFLPPYNDNFDTGTTPTDTVLANVSFAAVTADLNGSGRPDLMIGNGGTFSRFGDQNMLHFNTGKPFNQGTKILKPSSSTFPAPATFQDAAVFPFTPFYDYDPSTPAFDPLPPFADADFRPIEGVPFLFESFNPTPTTAVVLGDFDDDGDYDYVDANFQPSEDGPGPRIFTNEDGDYTGFATNFPHTMLPDIDDLGDGILIQRFDRIPILDNPLRGVVGQYDPRKTANTSVAAGDLTGNGLLDIVVGNYLDPDGAPNVLLINDGDGGGPGYFTDETEARLPTVIYTVQERPGVFRTIEEGKRDKTVAVDVGDLDGDGDLDIVFGNSVAFGSSQTPTRVLINDGTGNFTDESDLRLPELPEGAVGCMVLADFDGMGERTEDVNHNGVLDPGFDTDGDGYLENGEDSVFSDAAFNLGVVVHDNGVLDFLDMDGNGICNPSLDIFIGYADGPDILLMNDGEGNFIDMSNLLQNNAISPITQGVDVGDVDLDGDLDIFFCFNVQNLVSPEPRISPNCGMLINDLSGGSGQFSDASFEIPFPNTLEMQQGWLGRSRLHGDARDVDLVDFDGDGDLDLFVCQAGLHESGYSSGFNNYVMINRMKGDNWNGAVRRHTAVVLAGPPMVLAVSPPGAAPGQEVIVVVGGYNFSEGCVFDFGQGIEIMETPTIVSPQKAIISLRILETATIGPRVVQVETLTGLTGESRLGAFRVVDESSIPHETAADYPWTLYVTPKAPGYSKPDPAKSESGERLVSFE